VPAELSLAADLGSVPQAVDLSGYRIVQEALANVVRHAPGAPTRVSVTSDGSYLTVLVVNGPAPAPTSPLETTGTGHGLVGMRERVRLTGGSLDTGPLPDGGFRVAARLPLTADDTAGTSAENAGRTGNSTHTQRTEDAS
jgi:signal transduction histidine kinase